MYLPVYHREDRLDLQHDLIRAYPLGLLIATGKDGLIANPIPFLLDAEGGSKGVLKAHVARANPFWQEYDAAQEALVVFQGPQCYVSPNFYASKKETGRVVPTWNYVCVQAYGFLKIMDDEAWVEAQLRGLTAVHEATQQRPWSIDDAPPDFKATQLRAIVGIEIEIDRIEGKWKMSQNRVPKDRESLVAALYEMTDENAKAVASLVAAARQT
jgi:transcriptional regulator